MPLLPQINEDGTVEDADFEYPSEYSVFESRNYMDWEARFALGE